MNKSRNIKDIVEEAMKAPYLASPLRAEIEQLGGREYEPNIFERLSGEYNAPFACISSGDAGKLYVVGTMLMKSIAQQESKGSWYPRQVHVHAFTETGDFHSCMQAIGNEHGPLAIAYKPAPSMPLADEHLN